MHRSPKPVAREGHATVRAAAKINLRLRITGHRANGYHLLDSIVMPVSVFDGIRLRFRRSKTVSVHLTCRPALGPPEENLAVRAARLFLQRSDIGADVEIDLQKEIPAGAGLGGGSSDAAAVLVALNALCDGPLTEAQLSALGLALGADVPFFVTGRPARVQGIGEIVQPLRRWDALPITVAFPGTALSTAKVFGIYEDSLTKPAPLTNIPSLENDPTDFQRFVTNDLEAAAIRLCPRLAELKQRLRQLGAFHTLMSGSGSAVFGVWNRQAEAQEAAGRLREGGVWARTVEIVGRTPELEMHRARTDGR